MNHESAIVFGLLILLVCVVAARLLERTWLPPALLFFVGFFFHAFFTPAVYDSLDAINVKNLPYVYRFSLLSFGAIFVGYVLGHISRLRRSRMSLVSPPVSAQEIHPFFIRIVSLILVAYLFVYVVFISGALYQSKGVGAYQTDLNVFQRLGKLTIILPALLVAWYMLIQSRSRGVRKKCLEAVCFWCAAATVIVTNMLLFARQQQLTLILFLVLFHHYRVRRFAPGKFFFLVSAIVMLQFAAKLRTFDAGIGQLSFSDLAAHLEAAFRQGIIPMIISILSSLPGQDVFVEVVDIVQRTGHKHGLTYLQSVVGLAMPAFLGFQPPWETPAYWFRNEFAPEVENHGFDFSALAEAYLNFGDFGFLAFIAYGFVIARASLAVRAAPSLSGVLLGIIVLVWLTFGLRHDSYAVLKGILYMWLGVVILGKAGKLLALVVRVDGRSSPGVRL